MKKILKLIPLLFVMGLIYFFSSQPANDSTQTTNGVVEILYSVYHFIFAGKSLSYQQFCDMYFAPIRKLAHFSEFGLLGILVYINVDEYFKKHLILYSIIFSALYAVSDEIHQLFVAGRYCAIKDMLIDSSGAMVGILLIHLISKKCLKR